jgi:Spy/CpxP family protein refolding chaperone
MKRKTMIITLAVALIGLTAALSAQPPMPDGPHGKRGRGGPWDKMSANIENLRMMKMLEAVNPDEKQSEKFVPLVYAFRRDMKEIIEERNAQVDKIKESLKNDAGDNEIKAELDELRENKTKLDGRIDKFLGDCEEILSTKQMARLVIFQERFEREMLKSLREFRRHGEMDIDSMDNQTGRK